MDVALVMTQNLRVKIVVFIELFEIFVFVKTKSLTLSKLSLENSKLQL